MPSPPRRLDDVIDELGFGMAQFVLILCGGSVFLLTGSLTMFFSLLNDAIAEELGAGISGKGALLSVLFVGKLVGNLVSGALSDRIGRRLPFLAAIGGMTLTTICSSIVGSLSSLLAWRAAIGLCIGVAMPPWNAIAGEMSPSWARVEMTAVAMILFCVGVGYTVGVLTVCRPEDMGWRNLTVGFGLQGAVVLVAAYFGLPESLRYSDYRGLRDQSVATLRWVRHLNGRHDVDVDLWRSSEPEACVGAAPVFSRHLLPTTCTMSLVAFFLNFSYYGSMYALPQVLPGLTLGMSMLASFLLASAVETAGFFFAIALCRRATRKASLLVSVLGIGFTTAIFMGALRCSWSEGGDVGTSAAVVVNLAVAAGRLFQSVAWVVAYVYVSEVYPTSCRAFGASVAVAMGRIGGISAPMIFEWLLSATSSPSVFFALVLVLAALSAVLVRGLPVETKNRQLGEIGREAHSVRLVTELAKPV